MAKGSSSKRRPTVLVALLVAVGLAAAYLSDCIPGFGAGTGGSADPSSERSAPETEPAKAAEVKAEGEAAPTVVQITVEGEQCKTADGVVPCTELCAAEPEAARVEIDATVGSHGTVEALRKCLVEAGYSDVRVVSR